MPCDWVCYLIMSISSRETYVGATNNMKQRLSNHNNNNPNIKRKGAKRTRGKVWVPILVISGFISKNACLSFESGFKRLCKRRTNKRFDLINFAYESNLKYSSDPRDNRIVDLLYFTHNITTINGKFILNADYKHPVIQPDPLTANVFMEEWITELEFPHYFNVKMIDNI